MNEWTIYHNPRCSKSRQTLSLLEGKSIQPEIKEYLKTPPSATELKEVINKLSIEPHELLRKKESIFKELNLDISNGEAVIQAMVDNPVLIERPIVIRKDQAVLGRPPENVEKLF